MGRGGYKTLEEFKIISLAKCSRGGGFLFFIAKNGKLKMEKWSVVGLSQLRGNVSVEWNG